MNFTNKLISKTYGNVMVSDGFGNDTHQISSTDISAYDNTFLSSFDGYGNQSNLHLSLEGTNYYPHLKYGNNFVLPGSSLDVNSVIIGNNINPNLSSNFKTCNIKLNSDNVKIGDIIYPHKKLDANKIIYIKNNTITSGETFDNTIKNQKEETEYINQVLFEVGGMGSSAKSLQQYVRTVDLSEYINYDDNISTIWIDIHSYSYNAGYDRETQNRPPYLILKYNDLYFKLSGVATDSNGYYLYALSNDYSNRPAGGYGILGDISVGNIIGYNKDMWGSGNDGVYGKYPFNIDYSIPIPANSSSSIFSIYSLTNQDDGHWRHNSSNPFSGPTHHRTAIYTKATLSKITRLIKY